MLKRTPKKCRSGELNRKRNSSSQWESFIFSQSAFISPRSLLAVQKPTCSQLILSYWPECFLNNCTVYTCTCDCRLQRTLMHCSLPLARKIYGIISVLFPIRVVVLFVFLNVIAHSTGKILSFEVLSVLPPSSSGDFLSRELRGLRDNTPLTVVFSLPVIRLGTL